MDCNINKFNSDNEVLGTRLTHTKSFQDKGVKRYKSRNIPANDYGDFRNSWDNKPKKTYKQYDDQIMTNHTQPDHKLDNTSYKSMNGDRPYRNTTNNDRKPSLKSTFQEYSIAAYPDTKRNTKHREVYNKGAEKFRARDIKLDAQKADLNETSAHYRDSVSTKIKFNFLQESQLNVDKCKLDPRVSLVKKAPNNGLNPAAVEFTPNTALTTLCPPPKTIPQCTAAIENGFKSLSFGNDNDGHPISNPVVVEHPDQGHGGAQFTLSYPCKVGSVDPSMIHNVYQGAPLPLTRLGYPQPMGPQFQVALYGANGPLLRYNTTQNLPVNFPSNYVLYNPVMFNGLYNQCTPTLLTTANRLVPIGPADIPAHMGPPFAGYLGPYYPDSVNNAHIR